MTKRTRKRYRTLDDWMTANKMSARKLEEPSGVSHDVITRVRTYRIVPTIETAARLWVATRREVDLLSFVPPKKRVEIFGPKGRP